MGIRQEIADKMISELEDISIEASWTKNQRQKETE